MIRREPIGTTGRTSALLGLEPICAVHAPAMPTIERFKKKESVTYPQAIWESLVLFLVPPFVRGRAGRLSVAESKDSGINKPCYCATTLKCLRDHEEGLDRRFANRLKSF